MKRTLSRLMASVVATVALCALGGTASAQPFPMKGTFRLAYEVHWGRFVLPAGQYTIDMASRQSPAFVRDSAGQSRAILLCSSVDRSIEGRPTSLQIMQRENYRLVYALNWHEQDLAFEFARLTTAERKRLATTRESVGAPVVLARK
jgi:hypothetical protein